MTYAVELDERTHTYWVNGMEVPASVSGLATMVYGDDPDEYLEEAIERAADRGVTMHKVLELALSGEDYDGEYPAIYAPYVDSIEQFLAEHEIVPIAIEEPIYSPRMNIAGTPDLLCLYDDVLTLIDYKFVSAINKPKVRAQLLGYTEIFNEHGVFPAQMLAVQFTREKPRPYPVLPGGDEWAAALKIWEIRNRKYKRGVIG